MGMGRLGPHVVSQLLWASQDLNPALPAIEPKLYTKTYLRRANTLAYILSVANGGSGIGILIVKIAHGVIKLPQYLKKDITFAIELFR